MQLLKQQYGAYTAEDKEVWKTLFMRQVQNLESIASTRYLNALKKIAFSADKIPCFEEVNTILLQETGWSITVVPGIVPVNEFFELLAQKIFPATTWLRELSKLDYLEEPDMFHDVFGHVPLLVDPVYCRFLEGLAHIALRYIHHPAVMEALSRIYWYTIEFGLIMENGKKIYGAGILSSFGESLHCMSSLVKHTELNIQQVVQHAFIKSEMQEHYFTAASFEQLCDSLEEIRKEAERIAGSDQSYRVASMECRTERRV